MEGPVRLGHKNPWRRILQLSTVRTYDGSTDSEDLLRTSGMCGTTAQKCKALAHRVPTLQHSLAFAPSTPPSLQTIHWLVSLSAVLAPQKIRNNSSRPPVIFYKNTRLQQMPSLRPHHLRGIVSWTSADQTICCQSRRMSVEFFRISWIEAAQVLFSCTKSLEGNSSCSVFGWGAGTAKRETKQCIV